MRFSKMLVAALALSFASPAAACETGPYPITFAHGSAAFTGNSVAFIETMPLYREGYPNGFVRITLYNPKRGPAELWQSRILAVRTKLRRLGIPAKLIEVVEMPASKGMIGPRWIGRATTVEIEFMQGCG